MKKIVVIGASGHGKVIADIAEKNGYEEIVFFDDDCTIKECAGYPVIGRVDQAKDSDGDKIVAIGNAKIRERIQSKIKTVTLVHPDAVISRRVELGEGTVVMAGAVINSDVTIGKGSIINTCSSIDHDCVIGDFCHISVGSHLCGAVKIGERTWVGAGSTVSNNINITSDVMIGAGAVVVHSIEESGTYIGVPVKKMKKQMFGAGCPKTN